MYKFNDNEPIYLQLMDIIKQKIISGNLKQNQKIDSVRDLAIEYGVNPNTVQKSLSELEREGFLKTERTSGRFVAIPHVETEKVKVTLMESKTRDYISWMRKLNYSDTEIKNQIAVGLKRKGGAINE